MRAEYLPALAIRSSQGEYKVEIYPTISSVVEQIACAPAPFIIIDGQVSDRWKDLENSIRRFPAYRLVASEYEKSLGGVERALTAMQNAGASKKTTVFAIGGGVVQDIATLAAHLWSRGVDCILVPTTLLAMADSCIGAKCAVNLGSFKNQIGTFQAPKSVLLCQQFIETLSDEDVASGYGEIIKLAIIDSKSSFYELRDDLSSAGLRSPNVGRHIRSALEIKRRFIEEDEFDSGVRRVLNYGHTFGHALESLTDYSIPHGLSVAWGMDVANFVSMKLGRFPEADFADIHAFLASALPWRSRPKVALDPFIQAIGRDKKASAGQVNLILPNSIGDVAIRPTPIDEHLRGILAEYMQSRSLF